MRRGPALASPVPEFATSSSDVAPLRSAGVTLAVAPTV